MGDCFFEMKQTHLIQRVIDSLNLPSDLKTQDNPATGKVLTNNEEGPGLKNNLHYRSVIGMINYLEKNSIPEIAFAVHQCSRFSVNPLLSYEREVHRIFWYLSGTKDKGFFFKPQLEKGIEFYVDADFAGSWSNTKSDFPASVLSRTGFFIM